MRPCTSPLPAPRTASPPFPKPQEVRAHPPHIRIELTFGADAQGCLAGRACQLSPEFLDRGLHLILVPGQLPQSQDLHVGQRLIWKGRCRQVARSRGRGDRTARAPPWSASPKGRVREGRGPGPAGKRRAEHEARGAATGRCPSPRTAPGADRRDCAGTRAQEAGGGTTRAPNYFSASPTSRLKPQLLTRHSLTPWDKAAPSRMVTQSSARATPREVTLPRFGCPAQTPEWEAPDRAGAVVRGGAGPAFPRAPLPSVPLVRRGAGRQSTQGTRGPSLRPPRLYLTGQSCSRRWAPRPRRVGVPAPGLRSRVEIFGPVF